MLVDLSHTVEHGMVTYQGLPAPVISDFLSRQASRLRYAGGTEFHIGRIDMVANTGTYLDAPAHRFAEGADVAAIELDQVADLPAVLIRTAGPIEPNAIQNLDLRGKALLIHTGWSRHWRTDTYFNNKHPFVTRGAAEVMAKSGVRVVGIDSYNIDDTSDLTRPAHTELLRAGVLIVEHLTNLDALPDSGAIRFFAVPVKVRGLGTFPVRAFAMV
ncbi:MAG TPA: cyclase family protein [Thermoanaerobaculia bacterium]|nr:cyclase family protein [Thermoanaerobaculia bacterium]